MMSIRNLFIVIIICTGILVVFYLKDLTNFNIKPELLVHSPTTLRPNLSRSSWLLPSVHKELTSSLTPEMTRSEIVVALVVCGDRLQETLNLVKSALIFQLKNPLRIIILAEDNLIQSLEEKLSDWQVLRNHTFKFEIHNLKFPKGKEKDWKNLFKKCAAQRLFLPDILSHIDSVLYMDIDTLFLGPVLEVWRHFYLMNATQMAALVPEGEDVNSGWYSQYARHPYYGNTGVNSGVMLMNLTRMRSFGWVNYLGPIFKEFRTKIPWGDQDIINIIFYYHPDKLYIFPCRYNFRSDHCQYMSNCESAKSQGVVVLHGSRNSFLNHIIPPFSVIFQAFQEYQLNQDATEQLFQSLQAYLGETKLAKCGSNYENIYLKQMRSVIQPWVV